MEYNKMNTILFWEAEKNCQGEGYEADIIHIDIN